jgi:hypothetical protein
LAVSDDECPDAPDLLAAVHKLVNIAFMRYLLSPNAFRIDRVSPICLP